MVKTPDLATRLRELAGYAERGGAPEASEIAAYDGRTMRLIESQTDYTTQELNR
jgi:hypothetical protein